MSTRKLQLFALVLFYFSTLSIAVQAVEVRGTLQEWHRAELWFGGPQHAESDSNPNPFLDYRLQCAFTGPSAQVYEVPGFFDTNGAGGTSGNIWKCRFAPDETGSWQYMASFRQGPQVAVSLNPQAGTPLAFDGDAGSFVVVPSSKAGRDFRSPERGRLVNTGGHYLTFLGSGNRWIKGGPDVPENFLGYSGFDNTPQARHSFGTHVQDWNSGDPDWNSGAGRGIIGALNYIAEQGANSIYFLSMNIGGDGKDTFPTIAEQDKTHYDTSKLLQWETVFTHAGAHGIFLHFQLAETESGNENYHDNGSLGPQRKLYYRELIARFGHHLGLEWDLGEENDYGTTKRREFAAYLKAVDPYDHPVTTHTHTNQMEAFYGPLLGNGDFDMTAFQITEGGLSSGDAVEEWRDRSAAAGVPWVISIDEPQSIQNDPSDEANGYPNGRKDFMWPVYLSGGGGFEWYIQEDGGGHSFDQRVDNLREMQVALVWTGYALEFMDTLPFWEMAPDRSLGSSTAGGTTYVLARPGDTYALYNENGGSFTLNLSGHTGSFAVFWFNPRTGAWLDGGTVSGGGNVNLGSPPFAGDAAVHVARAGEGAPVASFTATPLSGDAPLTVLFDAASSFDDGEIVAYNWDFGDGTPGSGASITHIFAEPGSYTVTLIVTDDSGQTGSDVQTITVRDPDMSEPVTFYFEPIEDAYVQGSAGFNNGSLKVQPGFRTSYLKFRVAGVSGPVQQVRLRLHQITDPSSGLSIEVHASDVNSWSESTLQGNNAPPPAGLLANFNGPVPSGATIVFDLDPSALSGDGIYSLIISSPSGNDAWFGSSESSAPPELEVTLAPSPQETFELLVSLSSDRAMPSPLVGKTLSGAIFVFVRPETDIRQARFFLDDPERIGRPRQVENIPPFDFGGGSAPRARPFDTSRISDGPHTITAELALEDGRFVVVSSGFFVDNAPNCLSEDTTCDGLDDDCDGLIDDDVPATPTTCTITGQLECVDGSMISMCDLCNEVHRTWEQTLQAIATGVPEPGRLAQQALGLSGVCP
jgi:PKD repeat protein